MSSSFTKSWRSSSTHTEATAVFRCGRGGRRRGYRCLRSLTPPVPGSSKPRLPVGQVVECDQGCRLKFDFADENEGLYPGRRRLLRDAGPRPHPCAGTEVVAFSPSIELQNAVGGYFENHGGHSRRNMDKWPISPQPKLIGTCQQPSLLRLGLTSSVRSCARGC